MEAVIRKKTLYAVGASLLALLALTSALSYLDLGVWGLVIALAIAIAKAVLVMLFFMELYYSEHLTWIFAVAGIVWLLILISGTFADYLTRTNVIYTLR